MYLAVLVNVFLSEIGDLWNCIVFCLFQNVFPSLPERVRRAENAEKTQKTADPKHKSAAMLSYCGDEQYSRYCLSSEHGSARIFPSVLQRLIGQIGWRETQRIGFAVSPGI